MWGMEVQLRLFLISALHGGEWSTFTACLFKILGKNHRHPRTRCGRNKRVDKFLSLPAMEPRTILPIAQSTTRPRYVTTEQYIG
jgi:hypothetical protein